MNKGDRRSVKPRAAMKRKIGMAILVSALAQLALADSTVQQAQEELKEQGYYFGQINGDKNADTIAAIRRFQIRSGLQVTGELDQETLRALHAVSSSSTATTTTTPQPRDIEDFGNTTERVAPATSPSRDLQTYREQPAPAEPAASVFSDTPYETAPPELQERIIFGAQTLLRRRGFYKGESDGVFGPNLEFSLRAFQSRLGIPPNGRLDMDTLAALGLLPGQHGRTPMEMPHRRFAPSDEPPVRGEWIR
jgi:peptidoglycan hydrolase-like protein with peptidoglycan-binding domain